MSRRYFPQDALALWSHPDWVTQACNVYHHEGYRQARQTTRSFNKLLTQELWAIGGPAGLEKTIWNLVNLPPTEFSMRVPSVEVKLIPKKNVPNDADAGDDAIDPVITTNEEVEKRPIVVAPLVRKALSVHLSQILTVTGDHLLPREAIAYRPRRKNVVQNAILEVSRAIKGGLTHWAKLDVRSFFPSVPWRGIEDSLLGYGYPERFISYTMGLVKGSLAQRTSWNVWLPVETDSGTQAGLRESSILANLYLSRLDWHILGAEKQQTNKKPLFYRRYSDDILVMACSKEPVRRVVAQIIRWIETQGMKIKGVHP